MGVPPTTPVDDLYRRGLECFQQGDYERCLALSEEMLGEDPRSSLGLVLRGQALAELDRGDEAVDALQKATQISPDDFEPWFQLGVARMTAGQLREAAEAYRRAVEIAPHQAAAHVDLGHVLLALGHAGQALETLEAARGPTQDDTSVLRSLAEIYASVGKLHQALETTLKLLEANPDDVVACCDAAWLLLELKRNDEAGRQFGKLYQLDPESQLFATYGLAMAAIKRRSWRWALERAIDATRLDRYEFTTLVLRFVSGKLFGQDCDVTEAELDERFAMEYREHRRLLVENSSLRQR